MDLQEIRQYAQAQAAAEGDKAEAGAEDLQVRPLRAPMVPACTGTLLGKVLYTVLSVARVQALAVACTQHAGLSLDAALASTVQETCLGMHAVNLHHMACCCRPPLALCHLSCCRLAWPR